MELKNGSADIKGDLAEVNDNIKHIEDKYPFIITTFVAALGVLPKLLEGFGPNTKKVIVLAFPFILIIVLSYVADLYRQVAILRGYASYLEEVTNKDQNNKLHLWNSIYIDRLVQNNGTNVLIMLSSGGCFLYVIYCYSKILNTADSGDFVLPEKIFCISYILVGLILIVRQFLLNDRFRKQSYWVAKTKNEDRCRVLLFSECRNLIAESGVGKVLSLQTKALDTQKGIYYTTNAKEFFNIVHINTFGIKSYLLARKCRRKGIPVIITSHTIVEDFKNSFRGTYSKLNQNLFKKWLVHFYNYADLLISPTEYVKQLLKSDKYGIKVPIEVISNGVDNSLFNKLKSEQEKQEVLEVLNKKKKRNFIINKTDKIILSVGLYLERKGIEEFVELAKEVNEKAKTDSHYLNWKFIWAGHTNSLLIPFKINKAIRAAKKIDNIKFTGYIEHDLLAKVYRNSDVVLMLTKEETECLVILETLSSKTPLIVRDIEVFKDWLLEDSCRKFAPDLEFKPKSEKNPLVEELIRLLNETFENDNNTMLMTGEKIARDRDLEKCGEKISRLYNELYLARNPQS